MKQCNPGRHCWTCIAMPGMNTLKSMEPRDMDFNVWCRCNIDVQKVCGQK